MGWVHRRRDLGNLLFLDVRDRTGIVQVVFNKETQAEAHAKAEHARSEFVVAIEGKVVKREKANPEIATGEIELVAAKLHILNTAKTPPFPIEEEINAAEETRLRYRYLDLRRPKPHPNLALRHKIVLEMRKTMDEMGFIEVETPMLTRSTPEGARDYLVPSRVHHGQFYALPQSPQIFKQILMIGGLDRYFQIVKCFRDEDLRADRQPEFTQLDLEMSFPTQEDIFGVIENVMVRVCAVAGIQSTAPFPHMLYKDAIRKYGSDKPDLRFGMELHEVTECFPAEAKQKLQIEGNVFALAAPGGASVFAQAIGRIDGKSQIRGCARGVFCEDGRGGRDVDSRKADRRGKCEETGRGLRGEDAGVQRPELISQPLAESGQLAGERPRNGAVRHARRVVRVIERVAHGLADAHAAGTVPVPPPSQLPGPVRGPMVGRGQQGVPVDGQPVERIAHADRGEMRGLGGQGQGIDQHEARQVRPHPGRKAARPELGERVVPSVIGHHVVRRLRPAIEPDHRADRPARARAPAPPADPPALARVPAQPIHYPALPRVPVPEVGHDDVAWMGPFFQSHTIAFERPPRPDVRFPVRSRSPELASEPLLSVKPANQTT